MLGWDRHGGAILPGVTIGDVAILAAKSVIARDVPPCAMLPEPPARVIRHRFEELGGIVLDISSSYGNAEANIGRLARETGVRDQLFMAPRLLLSRRHERWKRGTGYSGTRAGGQSRNKSLLSCRRSR
ncbi:hypothetical protein ACFOW6_10680 [Fodinicurvata halophila]|uniref:Uncharacterized protein n=1 Tax=Fodinicurvata halophila TaxID=1419723 RepID=A0ABV8UMG2_9PROT